MTIPQDPMILVSYLNTQLRDFYSSLTELCQTMDLSEKEIRDKLSQIDYHYNEEKNQFI